MAVTRNAKEVDMTQAVAVGDYKIATSNGQIMVFVKEGCKDTLLKAYDVKNITDEKEELATFVEKFKAAYEERKKAGLFV
jgi:hypothetical protein